MTASWLDHRQLGVVTSSLALTAGGILPALLMGALAVQIQRDLGVGSAWIGGVLSLYFIAGAVLSVALGRGTDLLGWRRASIISGLLAAVVLLAIALVGARAWPVALLLAIGGAVMAGTVIATNLAMSRELPGGRLGLFLGVKQSAVPIAGMIAGASVPLIAVPYGWRVTFVSVAFVPLVAAAIAWRISPEPLADTVVDTTMPSQREKLPSRLLVLAAAKGFAAIFPGVLVGFVVITAVNVGLSEAAAGTLLATASVIGVSVRVLGGWIVDHLRSNGLREVAWLLAVGAGGALLIATQQTTLLIIGTLLAFGAGWGWPALFFYGVLREYPSFPGAATGVVQTGALIGTASGPFVFGVALERFGPVLPWIGVAVAGLTASALVFLALRLQRT